MKTDAVLERMHLDIVRAVSEQGSLTAAATTLHLTQSALSHSIAKLERHLGVAIWYRDGRHLRPTQAGTYLLGVANRMAPQFAHAEERLRQFADGVRGTLRIGMECHPCYRWLQKFTSTYLTAWPTVDMDVKQKFQFGGIGALIGHEIDILVTPDPLRKTSLQFEPVFDYEQVLVVGPDHALRHAAYVRPKDLANEVIITYPVPIDRLDVYARFLIPAGISPKRHMPIETTDIMLQLVANGRGVAALPRWVVEDYAQQHEVIPLRLGKQGIAKQISLGFRKVDLEIQYLKSFVDMARTNGQAKTKRS